ncbi:MAG: hypothetical protein ACJAYC_001581 [Halieaceae bacterium]|jgi:hypothetical protein
MFPANFRFKDYLTTENAEAIRQYVLSEAGTVYTELHGDVEIKASGAGRE